MGEIHGERPQQWQNKDQEKDEETATNGMKLRNIRAATRRERKEDNGLERKLASEATSETRLQPSSAGKGDRNRRDRRRRREGEEGGGLSTKEPREQTRHRTQRMQLKRSGNGARQRGDRDGLAGNAKPVQTVESNINADKAQLNAPRRNVAKPELRWHPKVDRHDAYIIYNYIIYIIILYI